MSEKTETISLDDLPPIEFIADGESDEVREANLQLVLPSPGYPTICLIMADAIVKHVDVILFDFTENTVHVRYQVDGLWHPMPSFDRESGDYMLATVKQIANLNYRERQQRQSGQFEAKYLNQKYPCRITSRGVPTGERVAIYIDRKRSALDDLEAIGMRESVRKHLIQEMNTSEGLILFSGMPEDGLSTTWRAALNSTDRFVRDFVVLEEKTHKEPDVVNIRSVTYDRKRGENPRTHLNDVLLNEPNVIGFTELSEAEDVNALCGLSLEHSITTFGRLHAKHAVEAVMRVLMLKPDVKKFAQALRVVVNQRVLRKLCETCRLAFPPSPELLAELGLPAERVPALYRQYQPNPEDLVDHRGNPIDLEPCANCGGLGYRGRTGIFEMLIINDEFRQAMMRGPSVKKLTKIAEASGHISLRDEGVVLVARGTTSLEELQRVLSK